MPGRDELDHLLNEILRRPDRRAGFEAQIEEDFVAERAVLVLDMSGFSRTTQARGIVEFLLMIRRLRRIADPIVARHGGDVLKAEADNLFCLFPSVVEAVASARAIVGAALEDDLYVSIGIGFGRVLLIGDDDVMGAEVNLASKLGEDVADRGEILLTEAARDFVPDEPAEERAAAVSGLDLRYAALS